MAYTTPVDFIAGDPLLAAELNLVQNNIRALHTADIEHYSINEVADYTTTSSSFVDIDATNLALTLITEGGDVEVHFYGTFSSSVSSNMNLEIDVDGSPYGGDGGIGLVALNTPPNQGERFVSFSCLVTGLTAGSHTFKIQWLTASGTVTLYAGVGTGVFAVHSQFWAKEVR